MKQSRLNCLHVVTCSMWESQIWKYLLGVISSSELGRRAACVIDLPSL